jgi:hypothetical protein
MKITFHPMRSEARLKLERQGDVLRVNDKAYDFSAVPEGASLPHTAVKGSWLADDVTRENGVLHLAVILPISKNASKKCRFPAPIKLSKDGPVTLPTDRIKRPARAKPTAKNKGV